MPEMKKAKSVTPRKNTPFNSLKWSKVSVRYFYNTGESSYGTFYTAGDLEYTINRYRDILQYEKEPVSEDVKEWFEWYKNLTDEEKKGWGDVNIYKKLIKVKIISFDGKKVNCIVE